MTDMKTRFPIYAALVLTSLMASCSKDFTSMADTDAPLEMKLQPALAPETKAGMQTSDLKEFWLQVENPQDPAYSYFTKVTKSGTDWNPADKMFWKSSSASVNYCAAFYNGHNFTQAEFTNGVDLTVPADQSTQKKLNSADLLILKSTNTTYQATDGKLPVELTHGLAKVNFVITLGDAFFDALIGLVYNPVKDLTIKGANTGFNYKPQTGAVTVKAGTNADVTPFLGAYTPSTPTAKTATAIFESILVPQTFAKGELKVGFRIGKGNYEWTNTSEITLESGKTYNLPISVNSAPPVETHNGRVYVDMGLSVKWATCNVGATTPFESGDYFAWGETEPYYESLDPLKWKADIHNGYYWDCYKWCNGSENTMTKYNAEDKQTTLEPGDDAATANWGGSWRTPTYDEWVELYGSSSFTWKTTAEGYAHDGLLITSIINGYSIFLSSGYFEKNKLYVSQSLYCSSSLKTGNPNYAFSFIYLGSTIGINIYHRCYGLPVRPVWP